MSSKELNAKIKKLEQLNIDYPIKNEVQEEYKLLLENEIASAKFALDIKQSCSTCEAHLNRSGDFVVSFGPPLSKEKMFARVCSYVKDGRPCVNPCKAISSMEQQALGWNPISEEDITSMLENKSK